MWQLIMAGRDSFPLGVSIDEISVCVSEGGKGRDSIRSGRIRENTVYFYVRPS